MRSRATVGLTAFACAAIAAGGFSAASTAQIPAPSGGSSGGGRAYVDPNGKAVAPANAPKRVRKAINAGNRIRKKPYIYGGGHRNFKRSKGYDCSGAVSYVLHAAGVLKRPMPSGPMARWGVRGRGDWITVYANRGHAFVVVAGLRFDTSSAGERRDQGKGPRWRFNGRSGKGFKKRSHPKL